MPTNEVPGPKSFFSLVNNEAKIGKVNFQALDMGKPSNAKDEVNIPKPYVLEAHARFGFSFVVRVMMKAKGFFFKFALIEGMNEEDLHLVPTWVKIHDISIVAFTADGLSLMATKLGNPIMLDLYISSICLQSWGRMDYARALIDIRADRELNEEMVIAIPNVECDGEVLHSVRVKYEWNPPRCGMCMIFGHDVMLCPKRVVGKPMNDGFRMDKGTSSSPKTTPFVDTNKVSISGYNKESPSNKGNTFSLSNSFEALNDENLIIKEVASGSMATTSGVGYGLKSLLEQWRKYKVVDDHVPYDNDMYEVQEIPDNIQTICGNLDIRVRVRKKK
nr:hypothetical protein [Tanacetum cinerariifolium]